MRNVVLALVVLSAFASGASAQSSWADKMFKANTTHDFGSVARGAQLFHQFKFTNIYAVPLEVMAIRTSCGCVNVTCPVKTLAARQETTIDVLMDARRFTGRKDVKIYVSVGPEYISTATLNISANCRTDVVFNPGQINFGVVPRGQAPTQTVDVEYAGVLDWRISEVVAGSAPAVVSLEEWYRRPGQIGYKVAVTLKADAPAGPHRHELYLRTNDPASPLVPLLVEATVQAPLTVSPATVALGTLKVGAPASQRVMIRASQPFRILGVEGGGDGVRAEAPTGVSTVHFVVVRCQPEKAGELRRQLLIKTDVAGEKPVTVTVEGRVEP
jgi:hypothetical protein